MKIPQPYLDLLLSEKEPGEVYRLCLERLESEEPEHTAALTGDIVYGCEIRYALEVLQNGRPTRLYNFGDLDGRGTPLLWRVLDPRPRSRVVFVGAGPYPVTAFLVRERYPEARLTCLENQLPAYLLGRAVASKMAPEMAFELADAHAYDYTEFDVVVVAAMVNDRHRLARRLLEQSGAELIVRGELDFRHPRLHTVGSTFDEEGKLAF